jgi:hypothetical protein
MINEHTIRKVCQNLAELLVKKNRDYGNSVQEQFNEYGLASILIRCDDKMRRIKNLEGKVALVDESLQDSMKDLAGYAVLGLLCLEDAPLPVKPHYYFDPDDQH